MKELTSLVLLSSCVGLFTAGCRDFVETSLFEDCDSETCGDVCKSTGFAAGLCSSGRCQCIEPADSEADVDGGSDGDADSDNGGDANRCDSDCADLVHSECSCDPSDPCGWRNSGFCDTELCADVTTEYFDDSLDCGIEANCDGECGLGYITPCTCGASDPCGWKNDGYCDTELCSDVIRRAIFDDSNDCGGGSSDCSDECAEGFHTACTCAFNDPCGWSGDGVCDQPDCREILGNEAFVDGLDCEPSNWSHSFGISAVRDDLDNHDAEIVTAGLSNNGFEMWVSNLNVSSGDLAFYLSEETTVHYHTGHGFEDGIATSDGDLYIQDITLGVRNAVFATCLSLSSSWEDSFGPSTEAVMGYSNVSFDFVDNDVADIFVDELTAGASYTQAWFLANASIYEVMDRWVIYQREGNHIIEYSARSGDDPADKSGDISFVDFQDGLLVETSILTMDSVIQEFEDISFMRAQVGERLSGASRDWVNANRAPVERARSEEIALDFIERELDGMPSDAALANVSEVRARSEDGISTTVAYVFHFGRVVAGLPVRGGSRADHIVVLVDSLGVVSWSFYWTKIMFESHEAQEPAITLSPSEALEAAATSINNAVKGRFVILETRAVVGVIRTGDDSTELRPAFEFIGSDGASVVVNATTGELLGRVPSIS